MKKIVSLLAVTAAMAVSAHAAVVLSDTFTYADGALVGNGGWTQTSSVATNPIQVLSGSAVVGNLGGQDIYNSGTGPMLTTAGSSIGATFSLSVPTTTTATNGDYFFHYGTTIGGTSGFYGKIWAKTDASSNLFLGLTTLATTNITYGAALTEGTAHTISLIYAFNGGTGLDTLSLVVDGSSYASYTAAEVSPGTLNEVNLRQGSNGGYPAVTVDNLVVTTAVPEPSTLAGLALGSAFLLARRRRTLKA